ncbi:MAG: class I SAM-dependent rRNA methyltransferase [Erysipelotrichaceae bacterium]|nr:class I SAM-dependent rRNA methyltransferase [Erysipelotrichaceae bacterium]
MRKTVTVNDKGREFLNNGQLWMYRNNLISDVEGIENGEIVDIIGEDEEYVATGFYSEFSHIVVRILTHVKTQVIDEEFFRNRIISAIKLRSTVVRNSTDNCRLIYGEADGLPGLTVDRYNDVLVTQVSCFGMEKIKGMIYAILLKEVEGAKYLYERNDIDIRKKEHLEMYKGFYTEATDTETVITENGIKLQVNFEDGQKTGYFLDQKHNRWLIQQMAYGKTAMDCFSHTGGFALNAAKGGARKVVAVDVSKTALDQGHRNAVLNGLENIISFKQADVFDYLDTVKRGEFEMIILDPPAFTKSRRTVDHAYNGYKEINLKAMKLLEDGGYLVTCSCSRFMEIENFEKMLKEAAKEAGIYLKQISVTQQNFDHPVLWTMNETSYLKFYIFQIVRE